MTEISSDNRTKKDIVDEFLEDVKKKLPFWLKDEKEELDEILEELENHIWDKATELADLEDPSEEHIRQVIEQMGKPSKIAAEYKHRGKPKYFITEELFPMYLKTLVITSALLFGLNFIGMLFSIGGGGVARSFFSGVFISLAIALILISIQFIYLSKEGYLPEDFQRFTSRLPFSINRWFETKKDAKKIESAAYEGPEIVSETGVTRSAPEMEKIEAYDDQYDRVEPFITTEPKVSIIKETKFVDKEPQVIKETIVMKEPRKEKTRIVKQKHWSGSYLSDGIAGIVFGTTFVILAFLPLLDFLRGPNYYPLNYWFAIFGGIILVGGVIRFMQAIVGRVLRVQQGLMFLHTLPAAAMIPLWLVLLKQVSVWGPYTDEVMNLFQAIVIKFGQLVSESFVFDPAIGLIVLKVIVYVNIGILAISILSELSKIARLEAEGFPVKEIEIYQ
ncbi:MAG: hypothetical protein FK730_04080 [Asgard group archaeon]|nr:hypothetical protein [Asgard group archaeon]